MEPSKIGTAITRLPRLISEIRLDRPNTGHDNGECGPQSHSAPPPVFGSLPRLVSAVVLEYARLFRRRDVPARTDRKSARPESVTYHRAQCPNRKRRSGCHWAAYRRRDGRRKGITDGDLLKVEAACSTPCNP